MSIPWVDHVSPGCPTDQQCWDIPIDYVTFSCYVLIGDTSGLISVYTAKKTKQNMVKCITDHLINWFVWMCPKCILVQCIFFFYTCILHCRLVNWLPMMHFNTKCKLGHSRCTLSNGYTTKTVRCNVVFSNYTTPHNVPNFTTVTFALPTNLNLVKENAFK